MLGSNPLASLSKQMSSRNQKMRQGLCLNLTRTSKAPRFACPMMAHGASARRLAQAKDWPASL